MGVGGGGGVGIKIVLLVLLWGTIVSLNGEMIRGLLISGLSHK